MITFILIYWESVVCVVNKCVMECESACELVQMCGLCKGCRYSVLQVVSTGNDRVKQTSGYSP